MQCRINGNKDFEHMSIFDWFRRKRKPKEIAPEQVEHPDQAMREIVSRVWNTGKPETGTIKDGNVTSCQFDPKTGKPLNK